MNIQFDGLSTKQFFEWIAKKFLEIAMPAIKQGVESTYSDDELLTKKELCERILKCDVNTADKHFLYQEGFPYMEIGNTRRYPKRQVEEWIKKNTKFN